MNKKYYLAYGSNLNKRQMEMRCPHSKAIGGFLLKDYELVFKYYLTVEKKEGAEVPVGIWEITSEDEKYLDYYEGYPTHYRKEYIPIEVDGKKAEALIYIMNDIRGIMAPSGMYMEICMEGYKDFNFNLNYLTDAFLKSM